MDTDPDTLATALYVTAGDLLKAHPEQVPARPVLGFVERISAADMRHGRQEMPGTMAVSPARLV